VSISDWDIRHLEALAALRLGDSEREELRAQLERILDYVGQLEAIDVTGVPPTSHVQDPGTVWREDRVLPSLRPEEALANAPDKRGSFYRVPRFLGEGGEEP
jgi:aspartyl-tRNA(Asn)/glutamyl-tRNA(Gln) amidotransferase subunit C